MRNPGACCGGQLEQFDGSSRSWCIVSHSFSLFVIAHTNRLAFFVADDDDKKNLTTGIKALKQSDKSALSSLSTVLRLEYEDGEATGLRRNIVDFVDKAALLAMKKKAKR